MTEITILNGQEIETLLTLPMAIRAVERAYLEKSRGTAAIWPMVFHEFTPGEADLDIKSGDIVGTGCFGLKVVSWFGSNPEKQLPALYGTSLLFDLNTGVPKALLNAGPITHFRTGAAGAVGAKYLARPDSRTLLMAGTGALAPYLVAAALCLMPQLEQVWLVNPHHPAQAEAVCAAICAKVDALLAACGCGRTAAIHAEENLERAVRHSDIILTATPAQEPFIQADWLRPGTHISCIGADMPGKQELESAVFHRAAAFCDDTVQCLSAGECEIPVRDGILKATTGEIGDVIAGTVQGRTDAQQITVFDSTGIALQDIACAAALLDAAQTRGMGRKVWL